MADLKIGTNSDLLFENGDLVMVRDQEAIAQHCQMRLATWFSESVYDPTDGTPFLEVIFAPGTSTNAIVFVLEQRILATPGVLTVALTPSLDRESRELTVTGRGTTIQGDVVFSIEINSGAAQVSVLAA